MWIACYHTPDFSIACEQAMRPDLMGVPLGLNGEDGALRAVSSEAATAGVRIGQTPSSARMFCPDLIILPYNLRLYNERAEPVWDRIACDSSFVEPISPEVCFAAFSGAGVRARALQAAEDMGRIAGAAVRMGLSLSRFTAHTAALRASADAPVVVEEGHEASLVADVPIHDLPQVTREERDRLRRLGVNVLGDVLSVSEEDLYRIFRERSLLLRRLALGRDREPIQALWPPDCEEHTLNLDCGMADEATLHVALRRCADQVSEKLQARGRRCRSVTLVLRSEAGRVSVHTELLHAPESRAEALLRTALRLLGRMDSAPQPSPGPVQARTPALRSQADDARPCDPPVSATLRAVIAETSESVQIALFDENRLSNVLPHEQRRRLDAVVDFVCERFGRHSVGRAAGLRRAAPFHLWTYPLTRRLNERIEVRTDSCGAPVCYHRNGTWCEVARVRNRWSEAEWSHGRMEERMVFRVETPGLGLAEMRLCGGEWRLAAVAD